MSEKQKSNLFKGLSVATILTLLTIFIYGVRKNDLTFDTQEQKQEHIKFVEKNHPINKVEVEASSIHRKDNAIHMSFDEKSRIIRYEERQTTIIKNQETLGSDMAEIKQLILNRR